MSSSDQSFDSVTIHCPCARSLLRELDEGNDRWGDKPWIFRGHNDASWFLMPSLYRDEKMAEVTYREFALVNSFVLTANLMELPLPADTTGFFHYYDHPKSITQTGVDDAFGDRIVYDYRHVAFAIAQHSGVPTRLLDFTHDPLVAAYFAGEVKALAKKLGASEEDRAQYLDEIFWKWENGADAEHLLMEYWNARQEIANSFPREIAVWAVRMDSMLLSTSLRVLDHPYSEIINLRAQKGVFVCDINRYDIKGEPPRSFNSELAKLVPLEGIYKFVMPVSGLQDLSFLLLKKGYSEAKLTPTYERVGRWAVESNEAEINRRLRERAGAT